MHGFVPRVLALFVSLTVAFPPPVFGLRAAQPENSLQRAGLEEVLRAQAVLLKPLGDAVVGYRKEDVMAAYNPHTQRGIIVHHAAAVPGLRHSDTTGADLVIAVKMVLDQGGRVEAVQVEKFLASQPPKAPPKAGLEEVRPLPSARPAVSPMRFLVDTSGGESRVLHFAQWAVLLDRAGLPIRFAGVTTADELTEAQATLPDEASRQMLADHIQVYDPADESGVSYGTALALAQMTVFEEPTSPQEIRRLTLREYNPLWVQWFLGELDRLGIQKLFEPTLRDRIEATLTAA